VRDLADADVGFEFPHNLVGDLAVAFRLLKFNPRTEDHFTRGIEVNGVDHLGSSQLGFQFPDSSLGKSLLLPCRVVLGVL